MDKKEIPQGRIALVTGTTRNVGKGIAIGLGEAGANFGMEFKTNLI